MHQAFYKLCPNCWNPLAGELAGAATVSIIGSSASGKTCYTTSLIRQIETRLAQPTAYEMSLEWEDDGGRKYFRDQRRTIFAEKALPEATQKQTSVQTLQIVLRFTVRKWRSRLRHGNQGVVRLVFPDPSGEIFDNLSDLYFVGSLFAARAIILIVDPLMSEAYRARLAAAGKEQPAYDVTDTATSLGNFVQVLRKLERQEDGKLDKQLAVVVGKCDEEGMFDPDDQRFGGQFPCQGRFYDPSLTAEVSERVAQHLIQDLEMPNVAALARQNFKDVAFFACSALGRPPVRVVEKGKVRLRLVDPTPRRVEEPLLWILHRWGYL
jgi:hypothetical protein